MKKSILTALVTTTILATSATAFAYGKGQNRGQGMMMSNLSADEIKARVEARISVNPNLKVADFEEKDGKYHYKIVTKDDSLVKEVTLDPQNPQRGGMMGFNNPSEPMTVEQVQSFLEGHLQMMGNENIKLGKVTQDGDMIKATIVTKDDSLVRELSIDPSNPRGVMAGLSGGLMGDRGMMKYNKNDRPMKRHHMKGHHGNMRQNPQDCYMRNNHWN